MKCTVETKDRKQLICRTIYLFFLLFEILINPASSDGKKYQSEELEFVNKVIGSHCVGFGLERKTADERQYAYNYKTDITKKTSFHNEWD